jgi:hypothetical protein
MTFRQRTLILLCLGILACGAYATARIYSATLVAYVVEESLIQKAPDGADAGLIRARFQGLVHSLPDRRSRLQRLMEMSQVLEKVQRLDPAGVERLLSIDD